MPLRTWHITFGTYATRLHSDARPTVDRRHNQRDTAFPPADPSRQWRPSDEPVILTRLQCQRIQRVLPTLCAKGGWDLRAVAAPSSPGAGDHVHILLDAPTDRDPKRIRHWLKRWLTQSLNQEFDRPPGGWWAEGGSTKPITDESYLRNVTRYIQRQRTPD